MRSWLRSLFRHEVEFFLICLCNMLFAVGKLLSPMPLGSSTIFQVVYICVVLFFMIEVVFLDSLFWSRAAFFLSAFCLVGVGIFSLFSAAFLASGGLLGNAFGLWLLASNASDVVGTLVLIAVLYRTCLSLEAKRERAGYR